VKSSKNCLEKRVKNLENNVYNKVANPEIPAMKQQIKTLREIILRNWESLKITEEEKIVLDKAIEFHDILKTGKIDIIIKQKVIKDRKNRKFQQEIIRKLIKHKRFEQKCKQRLQEEKENKQNCVNKSGILTVKSELNLQQSEMPATPKTPRYHYINKNNQLVIFNGIKNGKRMFCSENKANEIIKQMGLDMLDTIEKSFSEKSTKDSDDISVRTIESNDTVCEIETNSKTKGISKPEDRKEAKILGNGKNAKKNAKRRTKQELKQKEQTNSKVQSLIQMRDSMLKTMIELNASESQIQAYKAQMQERINGAKLDDQPTKNTKLDYDSDDDETKVWKQQKQIAINTVTQDYKQQVNQQTKYVEKALDKTQQVQKLELQHAHIMANMSKNPTKYKEQVMQLQKISNQIKEIQDQIANELLTNS
jgi:hypothetical protein